MKNKLRLEWRG